MALPAGKGTALDTYINPADALAETVRKQLSCYRRDGGGTRGVAQAQGDHWQFAMGREADGPDINCLSSVYRSTNLRMEFHIWRAEQVVGADGPSGEAGGQGVSEEAKGQRG